MESINGMFPEKSVHSIRINTKLVETTKKTGIPLSNVIETCLSHFATLSDEQRIQFLVDNDTDKVEVDKINEPYNYAEVAIKKAKESLGNKYTDRTSTKFLIAIGLMLLLAFLLPKDSD